MLSARRTTSALGTITLAAAGTFAASGASAATSGGTPKATPDTSWNLHYTTQATTVIKRMNQTATTTGTTDSVFNFSHGSLTSTLKLNDFKSPVKIGGLQIGYATIAQEPVGPAVGAVDPKTNRITQTQKAYLHIKDISPLGHGVINFVGSQCRTVNPVSMTVSGQMKGGFDPINLSGNFEIGQFQNCGISTGLVNKQVPGSGNSINLTLTPKA